MTESGCNLPPEIAIVLADVLERTVPGDAAQVEAFEKIGRVIAEKIREHDGNGEGAVDRRAHVDSEVSAGEHLGAAPTQSKPPPLKRSPGPIQPYYGEHLDHLARSIELSDDGVSVADFKITSPCHDARSSVIEYSGGSGRVALFCSICGKEYAHLAIAPLMTEDSRWAD